MSPTTNPLLTLMRAAHALRDATGDLLDHEVGSIMAAADELPINCEEFDALTPAVKAKINIHHAWGKFIVSHPNGVVTCDNEAEAVFLALCAQVLFGKSAR